VYSTKVYLLRGDNQTEHREKNKQVGIKSPSSEEEICGDENPQRDDYYDLEGNALLDGGFF